MNNENSSSINGMAKVRKLFLQNTIYLFEQLAHKQAELARYLCKYPGLITTCETMTTTINKWVNGKLRLPHHNEDLYMEAIAEFFTGSLLTEKHFEFLKTLGFQKKNYSDTELKFILLKAMQTKSLENLSRPSPKKNLIMTAGIIGISLVVLVLARMFLFCVLSNVQ